MRFIDNVRRRVKHKANKQDEIPEVRRNEQLRGHEINLAETYWIRTIQANSFANEIQFLWNRNQPKPRQVEQFLLFLDKNQMLHCRRRINNSSLPLTIKNPILLPSSHPFVDFLIHHTHEHIKHSAKGRQAVKRVLKRWVTCRKLEGLPYSSYNSPDLPSFWVSDDPPFTHTGLDFAGPLYIHTEGNQKKESNKCYICLFTCASRRAVHLELVLSLTVQSFLLAFRRFASRRGLPATLISDNAKTFKGSSRVV